MEEINMTGSSPSESPPPMENGFMTSRSDDIEDDSVCVQINGKTRSELNTAQANKKKKRKQI